MTAHSTPQWASTLNEARLPTGKEFACGRLGLCPARVRGGAAHTEHRECHQSGRNAQASMHL